MTRAAASLIVLSIGLMLAPDPLRAQNAYPSKPVKILVGFPAGSSADVAARILAKKLGDNLGQQFIVENKPGAGSNIATDAVAHASADGYTLLMGTVANTINASFAKNLGFNFATDFAPIALVATVPNILVAHPSLGVGSVSELITLAKSRPGQILYGSSGNGTSPHLSGELFNFMAGIKMVHVPYKGSSQAVTDLLAGRVGVMFSPASTVLPHIQAGTLKALASSGNKRAGVAPTLPTIAETGLAGFDTSVWFGLLAPAATPREIIERLAVAVNQALSSADVKAQLANQGIDALGGTPSDFARYIRQETEKWARVIEVSGAKIE
jgi:tripartite-type tricarboxylate transporter receptor subunit TctC